MLDPSARVPAGGALVLDESLIRDGALTLWFGERRLVVPAHVLSDRAGGAHLPRVLLDPQVATGLGYPIETLGLLARSEDPIPAGSADDLTGPVSVGPDPGAGPPIGQITFAVPVETPLTLWSGQGGVLVDPQSELPFVPADATAAWRIAALGLLLALLAAGAVITGWALERGDELGLLDRLGAGAAARRGLTALQAGVTVGIASLYCAVVVAGLTALGFAAYNDLSSTVLPVLWHVDSGLAILAVVGAPLLAAALGVLVAPARRRAGGIVGGPVRPTRAA